jgi:hypothetical protein
MLLLLLLLLLQNVLPRLHVASASVPPMLLLAGLACGWCQLHARRRAHWARIVWFSTMAALVYLLWCSCSTRGTIEIAVC